MAMQEGEYNAKRYWSRAAVVCGAVFLVVGTVHAQEPLPAGISDQELFGTMLSSSRWAAGPIHVCWEETAPSDARFRQISRQADEDTWQRYSAIQFTGWGACSGGTAGIHIHVSDEGSHT